MRLASVLLLGKYHLTPIICFVIFHLTLIYYSSENIFLLFIILFFGPNILLVIVY